MTIDPNLILATAATAESALTLARSQPHPSVSVDPVAVEKALNSLPEKARLGRLRDPEAPSFLLAAWNPQISEHVYLYCAVRDRLRASEIRVDEVTEQWGRAHVPRALFVDYESLDAAAAKIRQGRADWMSSATKAWGARFGDAGTVAIEGTPYGDIVVFVAPPMSAEDAEMWAEPGETSSTPRIYRTGTDWESREAGAVVSAAIADLKVPVWSFDDVSKLWGSAVPGGDVVRRRGHYVEGAGMRDVPTLIFRKGGAEKTYPVEDVYDLTASALVDFVRADAAALWGLAASDLEDATPPPPQRQTGKAQPRGQR
jgi:hypothetical protein